MPQNVNNTQNITDAQGNSIVYINPNYVDSTQFGLNLFGDRITDIAYALNENFIKLIQHFYSKIPPSNPVIGQDWFNQNDKQTYKWLGENWVQMNRDIIYDSFMYVKYDVENIREFVLDEFVFNFTMNNIKLYNQNMLNVRFIIDPFDSRKIILKESNVTTLYIIVFHPKDKISNPLINKKLEFLTTSGQTQFDIESLLDGTNINTLSVTLNDVLLKNTEFFVVNNILNIDGLIYRVRPDDKLTVWLNGGSFSNYYTTLKIHANRKEKFLKIPKFFKSINHMEIIDIDEKVSINPIETIEYNDYFYFEFLNTKNIKATINARII